MYSLEEAFAKAENAAAAVEQAAKKLQEKARRMRRAAEAGDVPRLKDAIKDVLAAVGQVESDRMVAADAWTLTDEHLTTYLEGKFDDELIDLARAEGVRLATMESNLLTDCPVVVRILPSQHSIKLDCTRIRTLRPSQIAKRIRERKPKSKDVSPHFVTMLLAAYKYVRALERTEKCSLSRIYEVLTMLPESKKSYDRAQFAYDIHKLAIAVQPAEQNDTATTKNAQLRNWKFDFQPMTTNKSSLFQVVPEAGNPINYGYVTITEIKPCQ